VVVAGANPNPPGPYDWAAGLEPDLSGSILFRSDRRAVGGNDVTDFEMWLAIGVDDDRWRYDFGSGWFLEVAPGITAGFGRDGGADQWHGAFAPLNVNSVRVLVVREISLPRGPDGRLPAKLIRSPQEDAYYSKMRRT
jgi:hypothetical protein